MKSFQFNYYYYFGELRMIDVNCDGAAAMSNYGRAVPVVVARTQQVRFVFPPQTTVPTLYSKFHFHFDFDFRHIRLGL